jgi:hypothetical protein
LQRTDTGLPRNKQGEFVLASVTRANLDGSGSTYDHTLPDRVPLRERGGSRVWVLADTLRVRDDPADAGHVFGLVCQSVTALRVDSGEVQRFERVHTQGKCPWGSDLGSLQMAGISESR